MTRSRLPSPIASVFAVALATAGLASGGCNGDAEPKPASPASSAADEPRPEVELEPKPEPPPGVQDDGEIVFAVDWYEPGLEQALADATHAEKLIFLDIGAYWCPPCHELDEHSFTDPAVGAWLREHALAIHIDAEKGDGPDIVARYDIQAYPTMLVLEGNGIEKGRLVDFIEPADLVTQLEAIAAGGNILAELEGAVEAEPDDLEARFRLAHAYVLAARRADAQALHEQLLVADPKNESGFAAKVFYDQALFFTLKLDADPAAAIAAFQTLQTRYPDSAEATRAYRMIGRAHCKLDQQDQAVVALQAMLATDPSDHALAASFGWFAFRQRCGAEPALRAVIAAIGAKPKDAELRYLEAELHDLLKQPDEALAAIREASKLEPKSAYYKRQVRRFEALASAAP